MKDIIIIGVGRFGFIVTKKLFKQGHEILAVDKKQERVQKVANYATYAVQANFVDEDVLEKFEIDKFDVGIVGIGKNSYANLAVVFILKKFDIPYVVAKAEDELHGELLKEVGADKIVYPERDTGIKVAGEINDNSTVKISN